MLVLELDNLEVEPPISLHVTQIIELSKKSITFLE